MLRNHLYYRFKPFLPQRLRMAMRRWHVRRLMPKVADVWPINEAAGRTPDGWPGWPDGKQFAVVLTHDVEGQAGLDRVRQLAELEMKHGFRSIFNFIPEGEYRVSPELRSWLVDNGFEVGVHDLHHDGKLYRNRETFRQHARKINRYLKEWNAVGFRSGFMHHNLDWLHDLDIQYDMSTFDTDPFEPQPDGANTIFPFWVPAPGSSLQAPSSALPPAPRSPLPASPSPLLAPRSTLQAPSSKLPLRGGYVELPYTLPQDSSVFLFHNANNIEIWKRKLRWIAQHGGMALLDTHPDYTDFTGNDHNGTSYSIGLYGEFLQHIRQKYGGQYWQVQPQDLASWFKKQVVDSNNLAGKPTVSNSNPAKSKPKIWIDLDNTPHVPFFEPIIAELKQRGHPVLVTARDAFQVCELAGEKGLDCIKIGRHYGKNPLLKVAGLFYRACQLAPTAIRERPAMGLSHGARSQIIFCNAFKIPTLLLADYEFAKTLPLMRPTWEMVPSVIPDSALCCKPAFIRKYSGLKEDVYAWMLKPDPRILDTLGLKATDLIVTVRPPATEAHYHNPEAELLFKAFMDRACQNSSVRVVLLPRNRKQGEEIRHQAPHWFVNGKTVIPAHAVDGMNLIWHSDLVVSGGGTMNREAAALGVPVYSIFRGTIGAVDRDLQRQGRLILVTSVAEVTSKIKLEKRARKSLAEVTSRETLNSIVNTIIELAESTAAKL